MTFELASGGTSVVVFTTTVFGLASDFTSFVVGITGWEAEGGAGAGLGVGVE